MASAQQPAPNRPGIMPGVNSYPMDVRTAPPRSLNVSTPSFAQLPPLPAAPAVPQPPPAPAVWQAALADPVPGSPEAAQPYPVQLEPPGIEVIAQSCQSDASLQERIRQEHIERRILERIVFPETPVLSTDSYEGRAWDPQKLTVAPNYVVYRRLYFQQNNFERYGWDLGLLTSVVSAGAFYWDFAMLPYHAMTDPCRCMDSNAGYCLPGDPVPLLLYPPELSLTGAVAEAGAVLALVAIFP